MAYNFKMVSFRFEEAAYSHHCSKIETADEIRTCANRNFQNEYLERFLTNNYLFSKLECRIFREITGIAFQCKLAGVHHVCVNVSR